MPRVRSAQSAGGAVGQDRLFTLPKAVIVLDGSGDGASEYVDALGGALVALLTEDPAADLAGVLGRAIADAAETAGGASSTVAIARWDAQTADALVLGDSRVAAIGLNGTVTELCDKRVDAVAAAQRERYQSRLRERHGFDDVHAGLVAELQAERARVRNTPGGYPIAASDPAAAAQALTASWPLQSLAALGLATDGAWRGRHTYQEIPPWPMLHKRIEFLAPKALLVAVTQAEADDPDGWRWPRLVRHDDKTLAVVSLR